MSNMYNNNDDDNYVFQNSTNDNYIITITRLGRSLAPLDSLKPRYNVIVKTR